MAQPTSPFSLRPMLGTATRRLRLRFEDSRLEAQFRKDYADHLMTASGWITASAILLYGGYFLLFDWLFGRSEFTIIAVCRAAVCVFFGGCLWLNHRLPGSGLPHLLVQSFPLPATFSLVFFAAVLPLEESIHYYGGFLICQFFLFCSGIYLLRESVFLTTALNLLYALIPAAVAEIGPTYYSGLMFMLSTSGLGLIAQWRIEWLLRQEYLRRRQLGVEITKSRVLAMKAESANRAKTDFLAHMSHELRTPLNAILGYAEIIRDQIMGRDPARYAEYAGHIHISGTHLLRLVEDLLNLSVIESGRMELDETEFLAAEPLLTALEVIRPVASKKRIACVQDLPRAVPEIRADRRAMLQILVNLLSNAVRFTPEGGRITVRMRAPQGAGIAVSVSDTGPGIAPDRIKRILEPFGTIREPLTASEGGTGLGLTIVKRLVEMHHGSLAIESPPGAGATVTVTLPAERVVCPAPANLP